MERGFPRLSPPVIAAVALVAVAAAGTAVAGSGPPAKRVTKQMVKKLAASQVEKLAPTLHVASSETATAAGTAETANHADAADQAAKAGQADTASDATTLQGAPPDAFQGRVTWAAVNTNGSIASQSGGIRVSAHPSSPAGVYYLDFGVPTSGKAIMITPRYPPASAAPGVFAAQPCGSAPDAGTCNAIGDPAGNPNDGNHLLVLAYDTNPSTVQTNEPFYIALIP